MRTTPTTPQWRAHQAAQEIVDRIRRSVAAIDALRIAEVAAGGLLTPSERRVFDYFARRAVRVSDLAVKIERRIGKPSGLTLCGGIMRRRDKDDDARANQAAIGDLP